MADIDKTYRIFVSAAEPSADSHCAGLITALQKINPNIEFVGVGGEQMAAAGCKLLENTADKAAMIHNAFAEVFRFLRLLRVIKRYLKKNKVDLVIVCDSPAFNFHVAAAAKRLGIKTLFYVAPQLWAWAPWRIRKLKKYCDKLCCILPFEQDWFEQRGVEATFVGNPMLEKFPTDLSNNRKSYDNFDPANATITFIPGSRNAEIDTLWPAMQKIARKIKYKYPNVNFTTVAVDKKRKQMLWSMQTVGFRCVYIIGSVDKAALDADFAIVASGSATLEVAAAGCPMVVMYQSNKILWHTVGRWLIKGKFLSLVNILAKRKMVPEFMPYFDSIEPISEAVEQMLTDRANLSVLSGELIELVEPLRQIIASEKTAQIASEMLKND